MPVKLTLESLVEAESKEKKDRIKKHNSWLYRTRYSIYILDRKKGLVRVQNDILEHSASWVEGKDRLTLVIGYLGSGVEDQTPMKGKSNTLNQLLPDSILQQLFRIHLNANWKALNVSEEKLSLGETQRKDRLQNLLGSNSLPQS